MQLKNNDIKVLYGVEGYLVDDEVPIIEDANDKDFITKLCCI